MKNSPSFRIYVGTYAKYNAGSLFGEWLDLQNYANLDEFYQACHQLHANETDPELMFQDYESIPNFLISESWIDEQVYAYWEAIENLNQEKIEALELYCQQISSWMPNKQNVGELMDNFNEAYQGYYGGSLKSPEEEFAYQFVEETGLLVDVSETLARYFDYEAYSRDMFLSGYSNYQGHIFLDH